MNCTPGELIEMKIETPNRMTELVRGNDTLLMAEFESLVREWNVVLDLNAIDRIDAAGIAALISLYGLAHESGHDFKVCNVRARVREMLTLVGLTPILVSHDAVPPPHVEDRLRRTAA